MLYDWTILANEKYILSITFSFSNIPNSSNKVDKWLQSPVCRIEIFNKVSAIKATVEQLTVGNWIK